MQICNSSFLRSYRDARISPFAALAAALLLAGCPQARDRAGGRRAAEEQAPAARPLPPVTAPPAFAQAQSGAKTVSLSDIAERAVRSVVNISSTRVIRRPGGHSPYHGNPFFDYFFRFRDREEEPPQRARSLGSGVIVSAEGVILTNNHVVESAEQIRVNLSDGRELGAELVGSDPKSDLAVLRLKSRPRGLQPLAIGDSGKLRLGEVVLAIGDPFGVGQTVTMGIVSAVGRANMGIVDYEDFIQTDAAINPGNSGGALVNMEGKLVGINTAILSRSGGYQGIGFAIPTAMARPIMESLLKHGRVIRGWLGVVIQTLDAEMAQALKLSVARGVLVADVQPGSPAARARIQRGDVITRINGQAVQSVSRLRNLIASSGAKVRVLVTLVRGGKTQEVPVVLADLPGEGGAPTLEPIQGALGGLRVEALTPEAARRLGLPPGMRGVLVTGAAPGSAAETAGLESGDVILEINRQAVASPQQLAALYREATGKILILVYRQGGTLYLLLEK